MGLLNDLISKTIQPEKMDPASEALVNNAKKLFLVTTSDINGYKIAAYFDVVSATEIFQAHTKVLNYTLAKAAEGLKGHEYFEAMEKVKHKLKIAALQQGANAIVQTRFSYTLAPGEISYIVIFGEGTAVKLEKATR